MNQSAYPYSAGIIALMSVILLTSHAAHSGTPGTGTEAGAVEHRGDQAFERLDRAIRSSPALQPVKDHSSTASHAIGYSPEQYLIGTGHGDLSKGRIICQRVAELSARSELAKQIRVLIKEHAIDHTRERTGYNTEQDLEVTREEIVQEYLQGVKIVDRQFDEIMGSCSSTAVMPRTSTAPKAGPESPGPAPVSSH